MVRKQQNKTTKPQQRNDDKKVAKTDDNVSAQCLGKTQNTKRKRRSTGGTYQATINETEIDTISAKTANTIVSTDDLKKIIN
jgi:hypothetical protein